MKKILIGSFILICQFLFAGTVHISPYPWLSVTYPDDATVFNMSCEKLSYDDPFYHAQGDTSSYIKVMEIIPDKSTGDLYTIMFYMGEGGYARYEFYLEGDCVTPAFVLFADHLILTGHGVIIAKGSMNEMFNRTRKYLIRKGAIREMPQPFYAVDLDSKAVKDFTIYRTKKCQRIIDHVKAGDDVRVLLTEYKHHYTRYLIRTEKGLTGWMKIDYGTWVNESPIKDIYYHGD